MKLITPWALGLIQPLIGCGDRIDTIADALVRDSSGVRIVENINPIWTESEAWRLGPTPSLDIGGADGDPDQQLFRVVDAVRLSDGRIVVANSGSNELLFFAANGSRGRRRGPW